ncbi:hypothetical protein SASPL_156127 [Salvia splendens]|uniref:MHD domain-containing protein n=1 Tax=Salvia splendens TaxID=180675 RepID=A0A8X8VX95_SALSN|nr:hypothetical protein SASPL_156127 [Salvia splendens]
MYYPFQGRHAQAEYGGGYAEEDPEMALYRRSLWPAIGEPVILRCQPYKIPLTELLLPHKILPVEFFRLWPSLPAIVECTGTYTYEGSGFKATAAQQYGESPFLSGLKSMLSKPFHKVCSHIIQTVAGFQMCYAAKTWIGGFVGMMIFGSSEVTRNVDLGDETTTMVCKFVVRASDANIAKEMGSDVQEWMDDLTDGSIEYMPEEEVKEAAAERLKMSMEHIALLKAARPRKMSDHEQQQERVYEDGKETTLFKLSAEEVEHRALQAAVLQEWHHLCKDRSTKLWPPSIILALEKNPFESTKISRSRFSSQSIGAPARSQPCRWRLPRFTSLIFAAMFSSIDSTRDDVGNILLNLRAFLPFFASGRNDNIILPLRPVFSVFEVVKKTEAIQILSVYTIEILRLSTLFKSYFGGSFDEDAIRNNFVLIYELLDEIMDFGYPQNPFSRNLEALYNSGSVRSPFFFQGQTADKPVPNATLQVTGAVGWRREGLVYKKNEVFLDIVESVNLLMSSKGSVLRCDVTGKILMKCFLSGMPDLKLGLNDKLDLRKNHSSNPVLLREFKLRFNSEKTVSFVPPDGEFELMKYRITEGVNLPFRVLPTIKELGRTRMEVNVKVGEECLWGQNVCSWSVIKIPVPKQTAKTSFQVTSGKAKYSPSIDCLVWKIRKFPGQTEPTLSAEVELISTITEKKSWTRPPIQMEFQVPMFTASGLRVRFLKVWEKSGYNTVEWVRYITKAGSYEVRC